MTCPIPLREFEPSVAGPKGAVFLPPSAYTSEAFYRFELASIWGKEWVAVGRVEEIPNPGDYFTVDIGGEPLILVRDEDGGVNAMSAVCRHRAMLVAQGSGHCKKHFVCPYHRWTYDRRGNLIGAPDMQGISTFDRSALGLPRMKVEVWEGVLFVNLNEHASALATRLASLAPIVSDWRLADLKNETVADPNARMHFSYEWNWKVYAEGQSECYHCDKLHGDTPTMAGIEFDSIKMLVDEPDNGVFAFNMRTKYIDHTLNHLGRAVFPAIETLPEAQRWLSYSIVIAPNIFMQLMSDCVIMLLWFPAGPEKMTIKRYRMYPQKTLDLPDFITRRQPEREAARYFVTQDDVAFEQVQHGLRSRFAPRGPISAKEPVLSGFSQWLVARYKAFEAA